MDTANLKDGMYAVIDTDKGEILLELEYKKCPMTVCNFVGLAKGVLNMDHPGVPFYDGQRLWYVLRLLPEIQGTENQCRRFLYQKIQQNLAVFRIALCAGLCNVAK